MAKIKITKQENPKKVLAIGAHPDDLEFTCTITLKDLMAEGYEVTYLVITNGENGFKLPGYTKEKRIKTRRKEQLDAAKMLGVKKVLFWNYKDGFLRYTENLRKKLILLIRHLKPELVFSFDPGNSTFDNLNLFHRDHRVAALAVFDSCFAAKNEYIYGKMAKPHQVSKLFLYGASNPDHFVDITKDIDFKLNILACHKSQFPDMDAFSKYFKENLAKYTPEYEYSEAFRVVEVRRII
ncbi:MAG: PIG-L family deacetylase [Ignavibacteriae bacterium]|nr:PIG-L family deacetylase [Ignavibacteriota bacterium]